MPASETPAPLRLYHYWRSSSSWRVRWALAIKRVECEFTHVGLLDGEAESAAHRGRNPLGYVPVLELGGESAQRRFLTESLPILEWLEETHPSPSLFPADPLLRARARQLAEIINSGTQPVHNLTVTHLHSDDPAEQKRWTQYWMHNGFAAYEHWASQSAGHFSVGNQISVADLCLIPQCYNAARFDVDVERYPTIRRIRDAALATPACQASAPERYKPAEA